MNQQLSMNKECLKTLIKLYQLKGYYFLEYANGWRYVYDANDEVVFSGHDSQYSRFEVWDEAIQQIKIKG